MKHRAVDMKPKAMNMKHMIINLQLWKSCKLQTNKYETPIINLEIETIKLETK